MKERIEQLKKAIEAFSVKTEKDVEQFRLQFLTKKSELNQLFADFKEVPSELKKELGKELNLLKNFAEETHRVHQETWSSANADAEKDLNDYTLPGYQSGSGNRHPLQIVRNRMTDIFMRMGFDVSEGPEIEDDWHNFSALNFPENHPARDMQDTFFIDADRSLRTHTSSVQVRVMESQKPPIRTISPGRVYRNEAISARSNCFFHQIEGLYIDKGVSFADLKQTLFQFVKEFFGADTQVRFRPSYFPFTEPSAEMDIYLGTGTEADYRLTKGSGWLEILGCGMVDKQVLSNCGIDPETYTGFAFGMGIERITMFQYGVKDLRTFFENDVRFLNQFASV
ncbi:MAG: phenylalanine--tRNA ligase subunit alpha [Flavobacteriales bacterium]|nr:phenylalanine--tRNA ligase subunit alpha [Bacteroidota bacterium]MCB9241308.1 phenylalanine--tRNA ligase subunit alpha [Flavobacteriales bacterium]